MKERKLHRLLSVICTLLLLSSCSTPVSPAQTAPSPLVSDTIVSDSTIGMETDTKTEEETDGKVSEQFSTDIYDVIEINGDSYLNFKNGNRITENDLADFAQQIGYIEFSSIDEMYRKLFVGELTSEQILIIKNAFTLTENGFVFPTISSLQIPVLPADFQSGGVGVIDDSYTVSLVTSADTTSGGAKFVDETLYRALYEKNYTNFYDNDNIMELSLVSGEFNGIPCQIGNFKTAAAAFRVVNFRLEIEGKILSFHIRYCIDSFRDNIAESDTCPHRIEIYCEQGEQFMIVTLHDLSFAPTVDWLTSFGLAPYSSAS